MAGAVVTVDVSTTRQCFVVGDGFVGAAPAATALANLPDIAVGDVLGSCMFNLLILSFMDAVQPSRSARGPTRVTRSPSGSA